jgi:ribosomal protein S18 acetylase RimI-like enzyme
VSGTVRVRPARPFDGPFIAGVLEMAGRGHLARGAWDVAFDDEGVRARALEELATAAPASWCHHSVFRVAEVDGVAAAALCAFGAGPTTEHDFGVALGHVHRHLGWSDAEIGTQIERLGPFLECFPDMPPGTWIVENVGTAAAYRRRGLVRELLDRALADGRAAGHARAQISCLVGNDPARRAYERAGFEVVEERTHPAFEALLGTPGFVRMTMRL